MENFSVLNCKFFGGQGESPCNQSDDHNRLRDMGQTMACEGTQAVLATLLQSVRRKIANDMLRFADLSKNILPG
mgnify:CR=1 FL=1